MHIYMNIPHVQFNLYVAGVAEMVVGKMVHADEHGCQILLDADSSLHAYNWDVIQHITLA